MDKRLKFRKMLESDQIIVAPGAPDALTARIIERTGFDVCYMGGNGAVANMLGLPDIGLATFSDMCNHARNISASIDIPLICDADTGYGNVNNVIRTVRAFEQAGVTGIHLEDQVTPKKCGAMEGIELISVEESVAKIRAAVFARRDPNFIIIARTDSRAVLGLDEAISRIQAYEDAGADLVYVEMLQSREEVKRVVESVTVPVVFDTLESTAESAIPNKDLEELGVKMVIYSMSATLYKAQMMSQFMEDLKKTGTTRHHIDDMMPLHEYEKLLGIEEQISYQEDFSAIK